MAKLDIKKERLRLAWVSAAEGLKFAKEVEAVQEVVHGITDEEIRKGIKAFTPKKKGSG